MKNITITIITLLFLSSCASNKDEITLKQNTNNDYRLNCRDIIREINNADAYKTYARRHDRFSLRNMLIIPAITTAFKAPAMEKKADERITYLQKIYSQKNCHSGYNTFY